MPIVKGGLLLLLPPPLSCLAVTIQLSRIEVSSWCGAASPGASNRDSVVAFVRCHR